MFGLMFFMTQYLQGVLGYDALDAGLRTLPIAGGLIARRAAVGASSASASGPRRRRPPACSSSPARWCGCRAPTRSSGFGLIGGSQALLGFGIGLAMAPATDSIMGAVPQDRASVGSAVNDTNRLVGGALGVAILGSLLSTLYRGDMEPATERPARAAREPARDTLGGALGVADRVGGPAGRALHDAATGAFVGAMQTTVLVAAGVALAGAALAARYLPPARPRPPTPRSRPRGRALAEPAPA